MRRLTIALALLLFVPVLYAATPKGVELNSDAADAVLTILEKKRSGLEIEEGDWTRLFESEPYVRLHQREAAMKREFTDDSFKEFVLSDELAASENSLRETLDRWKKANLSAAAGKALAYLPEGSTVGAKVYPMIKPKTNSFVWEISTNPAIFLYLDPKVTPEKFENTVAHEFHHIGFGGHCPTPKVEAEIDALPERAGWVVNRLRAFGEGFAMLAAAGSADTHPQEVSPDEERAQWDSDMAELEPNLRKVEAWIKGSIEGTLSDEERNATFRSFYGDQGPWYTVGWAMASAIERSAGRQALLEAFCDPRLLIPTYNKAAHKLSLPLWSDEVIEMLSQY